MLKKTIKSISHSPSVFDHFVSKQVMQPQKSGSHGSAHK
jgi:hypothetical protein